MKRISLEEYKLYLIDNYKHECDNTERQRIKRMNLLNSKYDNEFLEM